MHLSRNQWLGDMPSLVILERPQAQWETLNIAYFKRVQRGALREIALAKCFAVSSPTLYIRPLVAQFQKLVAMTYLSRQRIVSNNSSTFDLDHNPIWRHHIR